MAWKCLLVLTLAVSAGQLYRTYAQSASTCSDAKSCGECISLDPSCGWCTLLNYTDETGNPQCDVASSLRLKGCSQVVDPDSTKITVKDAPLSNAGSAQGQAVQVKPQEVSLRLRKGKPVELTLQVRQAEDYPVDLYYVMDLSKSMEDDLSKLRDLGDTLASEMKNITSNFRLGFGSFVDKTVMPYVSTVPEKLIAPCTGCEAPYGFKNVLPLNENTDSFSQTVMRQQASGNLDAPEGGMDALMQITVCGQQIGWRENARHLVIYTTDSSFHYAGDGKLGGIITPNDGRCHLDPISQNYTMSHYLDYPSISHLNAKMRENSVIPIFAVVQQEFEVYNNLTQYIEGATAGVLAQDSNNIVQLVKDNYNKITSKVEVVDDAPDSVNIEYIAHCPGGQVFPGSQVCEGLKLGDTVNFTLTVTSTGCPANKNQQFTVRPIGFNEELKVNVQFECDCECEQQKVPNSPTCSGGNGTLECGSCICNTGHYGRYCECSSDDPSLEDNDAPCRSPNTTIVCSGRGSCVCGNCICFPRPKPTEVVSGPFCECDNFNCDRYQGELCGGEDRGRCVCDEYLRRSRCQCKPGYSGDACECSTRTDTCMTQDTICNGQGVCVCGECRCNATSAYRGPLCQDCPTCSGQCSRNEKCVQCKAFGTGLPKDECDMCPFPVIMVDNLEIPDGSEKCLAEDEDDCSIIFTYDKFPNGSLVLYVQREKVCFVPVNIHHVIIGIIIGIIIVGLALLLVWRLLVFVQDRREFALFEKERQDTRWGQNENPIYKPSTSTFKNPVYQK
ncbi:integrin beta-1-B-like [Lytechinus variegatus]|uniref:integrin beta-1-B-like n=1 Tax=Lytechinus variegatus TaxID=7654 RepID=UPI001BB1541C|nr:integrin beta-1-B-like [Lytechinus variegatus]